MSACFSPPPEPAAPHAFDVRIEIADNGWTRVDVGADSMNAATITVAYFRAITTMRRYALLAIYAAEGEWPYEGAVPDPDTLRTAERSWRVAVNELERRLPSRAPEPS